MDSYEKFFEYFNIDKDRFFQWGLEATVFPKQEEVEKEWENLKKRVLGGEKVFIRGYGRDAHGTQLYQELYAQLFGNTHVTKDPTNNAAPHRLIQKLTGLKRNSDIFNYQVSHIWGHTKNVFMFEAPWNICYTPKIMDPFTGHESSGKWSKEYQRLFISKAFELYGRFVDDYNKVMIEYDVVNKASRFIEYLRGRIPENELSQFEHDVKSELAPIDII